jgi:DNA polymerase I
MSNYIWSGSTWTKQNGKPVTILFGRDVDNPMVTKAIGLGNQRPYFYAPEDEVMGQRRRNEIVEVEEGYLDAFGRKVAKCYTVLPSDVPKVRGDFSFTCEADIVYDMRYLIDHKIYYGFNDKGDPVDVPMMSPRTCEFDIEVNSPPDVMPTWEDPIWPINQIQVGDSYTGDIKVFTFGYDLVDPDQINFQTEEEVIRAFCHWVWDTDPDVLAGWNIIAFDIPYIIERARKLNVDISRLSRWPSTYPTAQRFIGREIFDSYIFYKDWSKPKGQLPSYTLKYVVEHETGWTYTNQGDKIRSLVDRKDWTSLVDYGKNDVLALRKIHEETKIIEFYEALRRMTGIKLTDCLHRSKIIELYLMHRGIKPLPTKKHDAEKVPYEGALVLQPTFGIHEWTGTTDLKSLYPTIMIAYNISPDIDKMIPKVLVELMEAREVMRRLKLEGKASKAMLTSEQSLKYVINAFYGYLAFTGARLHKPELAAFITLKGREISLALHDEIRKMGYEIVYGDTDSTFMKPVRTVEEGQKIETTLNDYLLQWSRSIGVADHLAPTLKLEKIYKTLMFKKRADGDGAAQKRYAGILVWKEGKDLSGKNEVDYTGLEVKRSDTAIVTRDLMKAFFPIVLGERDIKKAAALVKVKYHQVLRGELSVQEVAIPKGISKGRSHMTPGSSPWIRGKEIGRQLLGIQFKSDKKPKLLYCKGNLFDCICIDDDTSDSDVRAVCVVDWETMALKTIEMKMKSLIESIGLSWEAEILGQQGLDRWC